MNSLLSAFLASGSDQAAYTGMEWHGNDVCEEFEMKSL